MDTRTLIQYINWHSGFVSSDVIGMISEFSDVILDQLQNATPVRLEGIGIFSQAIKLDGTINIKFRPDKSLVNELNNSHYLKDHITNRKNIRKLLSDLEVIDND